MIHQVTRVSANYETPVSIFVFGDRQAGSEGYNKEAWQEFKRHFKSTPNAWALGVGDYNGWLRPTMRAHLQSATAKDTSARKQLDKLVMQDHDKTIEDMEFLKDKCIGLHEGHHNWTFITNDNTDMRLANALKAPYLGWMASTRLVIDYNSPKTTKKSRFGLTYTIVSMHGNSNASSFPSSARWMETRVVNAWIADQHIMGHGCKNGNFEPHVQNIIRRRGPAGIDTKIPRCLIVGGFCDGFTNGWESGYVEQRGFAPQPLGWGVIRLKFVHTNQAALARGLEATGTGKSAISLDVEQLNKNPLG